MNIEETKRAIKVMQAFADGKPTQIKGRHFVDVEWADIKPSNNPLWNWCSWDYRIKPENIKYRRYLRKYYDKPGVICIAVGDLGYHENECGFVRWIDTEWQEEIV